MFKKSFERLETSSDHVKIGKVQRRVQIFDLKCLHKNQEHIYFLKNIFNVFKLRQMMWFKGKRSNFCSD